MRRRLVVTIEVDESRIGAASFEVFEETVTTLAGGLREEIGPRRELAGGWCSLTAGGCVVQDIDRLVPAVHEDSSGNDAFTQAVEYAADLLVALTP